MKNNQIIKNVLTLTIISLVCGLLIALIHFVTKPIIEANSVKAEEKAINNIVPSKYSNYSKNEKNIIFNDVEYKYYEIYNSDSNENYGHVFISNVKNQFGNIKIIVFVNNYIIENISLVELDLSAFQTETKDYIKTLVNFDLNESFPPHLLSGGTVSYNSVINCLNNIKDLYFYVIAGL